MQEILDAQKAEANIQFCKFIEQHYESWFKQESAPELSHTIFKHQVLPEINSQQPTLLLMIDNLRLDQWKVIESNVNVYYKTALETVYFSILPTSTQYARNAFFSGLLPNDMKVKYPKFWKDDNDEGGKNLFENEFLKHQLQRLNRSDISWEYFKITNLKDGKKLASQIKTKTKNDLTVVVYNFVDMLSHSKTDMQVVKELASDDKGYRSLTQSWFKNSPLLEIIKQAQQLNFKLIITTDHGTINVKHPSKVIGDKNASLNLRYKTSRSLSYDSKDVFAVKNPNAVGLPSVSLNSDFIFAKDNLFFAYPNNFNHYVNYYRNTYQHGGVSLEEMIIPFVILNPK